MKTIYEYKRNGFQNGEYSIYENTYRNDLHTSQTYCFGVGRKYEAQNACRYLNFLLTKRNNAQGGAK